MSQRAHRAIVSRTATDSQFLRQRQAASALTPPAKGWIRSIRDALGMSARELGQRLGVSPSTVLRTEAHEASGSVNLSTMSRYAEALECDLVVALVPKRPLSEHVLEQALAIARERAEKTQHTMQLEAQGLSPEQLETLIRRDADRIATQRNLWGHDWVRQSSA